MDRERTSVGLDVHARSVVACGIDDDTGEMFRTRLVSQPEVILGWLRELPGPVAVTYEAGPTGLLVRGDVLVAEVDLGRISLQAGVIPAVRQLHVALAHEAALAVGVEDDGRWRAPRLRTAHLR